MLSAEVPKKHTWSIDIPCRLGNKDWLLRTPRGLNNQKNWLLSFWSFGTTLGRPFQAFRAPTKIPQGPGCRFDRWFLDLMTNWAHFKDKSFKNHAHHVFSAKYIKQNNKKNGRDAGHRSPELGCTKTEASLNNQIFWLLDFWAWLLRSLTTRKSLTTSPISQSDR